MDILSLFIIFFRAKNTSLSCCGKSLKMSTTKQHRHVLYFVRILKKNLLVKMLFRNIEERFDVDDPRVVYKIINLPTFFDGPSARAPISQINADCIHGGKVGF